MLVLIKQLEDQRVGQGGAGGRRVERLAEGVGSVEWRLLDAAEEAPRVHLHVGDGTKAPVDLAFDAKDGRLLSAQVVLQDEAVGERHVFGGELPREPGVPLADVTPWRDEEQIVNDHEDEDEGERARRPCIVDAASDVATDPASVTKTSPSGTRSASVAITFDHVGLDPGSYVRLDPKFLRPAEVEQLVGDASKAREQLGWEPHTAFEELTRLMVDADLELLASGVPQKQAD